MRSNLYAHHLPNDLGLPSEYGKFIEKAIIVNNRGCKW